MLKTMIKPDDFKKQGGKAEIFTPLLETEVIYVPFNTVGKNINDIIKNKLILKIEGKCMKDGFIEPGSTAIITISSGTLVNCNVKYIVAYQSMVCFPV